MSTTPSEAPQGVSPMTAGELAALTPENLDALRVAAVNEQDRRRNAEVIPAEIERLSGIYNRIKGPSWPELPDAVQKFKARNPNL